MKKSIIKNLIALTFALGALVFVAGNVFGQMQMELGSGTCSAIDSSGVIIVGASSADAQWWVSGGGRWCCDSCATASWLR